jgi:threonine dehydrogenase-like Zn-dependent dehydrogenase
VRVLCAFANSILTLSKGYDKNIRLHMGRCPVRSIFLEALDCLNECQEKLGFLTETIVPLSDATQWYERFERMEVQKVIFDVEK